MDFEIGDMVRLIHSGEEGKVLEVLSKDMVRVEVGGVEFPVFKDQLEYPYFNRFVEMRKQHRENKKRPKGEDLPVEQSKPDLKEDKGMSLLVLPVYETDDTVKELKLYLSNESFSAYAYIFKEFLWENLEIELKSHIRPFSKVFLKDFPFDQLNDHPKLELIFEPEKRTKNQAPSFTFSLKLKAKQIFKKLAHLEARQNASFSFQIFKVYPKSEVQERQDWIPAVSDAILTGQIENARVSGQALPYEVDLHIEKLTDNFRNMTPTDMLLLQLSVLEKALDKAIANRQYSLVVIHGVGKGVLKREVHAVLKRTPFVRSFVNQYDFRYGFGATEIFFEYP